MSIIFNFYLFSNFNLKIKMLFLLTILLQFVKSESIDCNRQITRANSFNLDHEILFTDKTQVLTEIGNIDLIFENSDP